MFLARIVGLSGRISLFPILYSLLLVVLVLVVVLVEIKLV